jgi:hypothetical protein
VANAYGCALRDSGRLDEAIAVLETAIAKWPPTLDPGEPPERPHPEGKCLAKAVDPKAESFFLARAS